MNEATVLSAPTAAQAKANPEKPGRVTVVANLKGGVGKTTSLINLASGLARGLQRPQWNGEQLAPQAVLIVDMEPLRTVSRCLGVEAQGTADSSAVLLEGVAEDDEFGFTTTSDDQTRQFRERLFSLTRPAAREPLDVIPSDEKGVKIADVATATSSDTAFRDSLSVLRERYDHILVDLPGHSDNRVFRSALLAADGVIIPIEPDVTVLQSMGPMIRSIQNHRAVNPALQLDGILINKAGHRGDKDAALTKRGLDGLSSRGIYTFESMIRTLKPIRRAASESASVWAISGNEDATWDYSLFITEWLNRIGG